MTLAAVTTCNSSVPVKTSTCKRSVCLLSRDLNLHHLIIILIVVGLHSCCALLIHPIQPAKGVNSTSIVHPHPSSEAYDLCNKLSPIQTLHRVAPFWCLRCIFDDRHGCSARKPRPAAPRAPAVLLETLFKHCEVLKCGKKMQKDANSIK